MYRGKSVLVTGGTGLIGTPLVEMLIERGAEVRVASLDDPSRANPRTEFVHGDLMNPGFCREIVSGMDFVFHLAGIKGSTGIGVRRAASFMVPIMLMNTNVMEAARLEGVERLLYTSSIAVYEPVEIFVEDKAWDGPPHESDKYAAWAKRLGELLAEAYKVEYGWDKIAIVRPANVYGPHDNFDPETAMVVPALIARVVGGEDPLVVWGDGSAVRDFIFAEDCAEGMLLALEKGADCQPVNLGSGAGVRVREIVDAVIACHDPAPSIRWDTSRPAGQPKRLMDITRAEQKLGFRARTSIQEGVRQTYEWYVRNRETASRRYNVFHQRERL